MAKQKILDLKNQNLHFIQKDETVKLLSFNKEKMSLEIAIYKDEKFIKNSSMVYAHLPKSLKPQLNPIK